MNDGTSPTPGKKSLPEGGASPRNVGKKRGSKDPTSPPPREERGGVFKDPGGRKKRRCRDFLNNVKRKKRTLLMFDIMDLPGGKEGK